MRLLQERPKLVLVVTAVGLLDVARAVAAPEQLCNLVPFAKVEESKMAVDKWWREHGEVPSMHVPLSEVVPLVGQLCQSLIDLNKSFWDSAARETLSREIFESVGLYFQSILGKIDRKYSSVLQKIRSARKVPIASQEAARPIDSIKPNPYESLWRPLMAYYESFHLLGPAISPAVWKLIEAKNCALDLLIKLSGVTSLTYDFTAKNYDFPRKDEAELMVQQVVQAYDHYMRVRGQLQEIMDATLEYDYIFEPSLLEMSLSLEACRFCTKYAHIDKILGSSWAEDERMSLKQDLRRVLLGLERQFQQEIAGQHGLDSGKPLVLSLGRHYWLEKDLAKLQESIATATTGSIPSIIKLLRQEAPAWYRSGVQATELQELAHHLMALPGAKDPLFAEDVAKINSEYLEEASSDLPLENLHLYLTDVTNQAQYLIRSLSAQYSQKPAKHFLELTALLRQYYFLAMSCQPTRAAELYPLSWADLNQIVVEQTAEAVKFDQSYSRVLELPDYQLADLFSKGGPLSAIINIGIRVLCELSPIGDRLRCQNMISYPLPVEGGGTKRAN